MPAGSCGWRWVIVSTAASGQAGGEVEEDRAEILAARGAGVQRGDAGEVFLAAPAGQQAAAVFELDLSGGQFARLAPGAELEEGEGARHLERADDLAHARIGELERDLVGQLAQREPLIDPTAHFGGGRGRDLARGHREFLDRGDRHHLGDELLDDVGELRVGGQEDLGDQHLLDRADIGDRQRPSTWASVTRISGP
jgi:hypothetical protein